MNSSVTSMIVAFGSVCVFIGLVFLVGDTPQTEPRFATWGGTGTVTSFKDAELTGTSEQFTYTQPSVLLPSLRPAEESKTLLATEEKTVFRSSLKQTPYTIEDLSGVLSLIPTGLMTVAKGVNRSPAQQSLYEYGNTVGEALEELDIQYGSRQVSIMKDFYSDRLSQSKKDAVRSLAHALAETGTILSEEVEVPESVRTLHSKFAGGYRDLGARLLQIVDAEGDEELLSRINAYNTSAEQFAVSYAGLAQFFSTMGVTFTQSEPGRMFMFTGQAGL